MKPALVIMAKEPAPGKTKTRLSPPLTPTAAAELYEALLLDTVELASSLPQAHLAVAFSPPSSEPWFRRAVPRGVSLLPVQGESIGRCLEIAFDLLLGEGFGPVAALHSDGPFFTRDTVRLALASLESCDLVLGPCDDGGYYLIGMKSPRPELFKDIPWSSTHVTGETRRRAASMGLDVRLLPPSFDVDGAGDLERLRRELLSRPPADLTNTRRVFFAAEGGGDEG